MKTKYKLLSLVFLTLLIGVTLTPVTGLEKIDKNQTLDKTIVKKTGRLNGITFYQLDYKKENESCIDSHIGAVVVDKELITSQHNLTSGYMNIMTPLGWVVQNWYISSDEDNGIIPYAFYKFHLREGPPCGIDVSDIDFYFEFSEEPKNSFQGGQFTGDGVNPGDVPPPECFTCTPGDPKPPEWGWNQTFENSLKPEYLENVQAAKNQCGPAAVANSLQYLENRFPERVNILHNNTMGYGNSDDGHPYPEDSLVAHLDLAMNRKNVISRITGEGVDMKQFLEGKLRYLDSYYDVIWGQPIGVMHQCTSDFTKDVTIGNTISKYKEKISVNFIIEKIGQEFDVEALFTRDSCDRGHVVQVIAAGQILGVPYIRHISDLLQHHVDLEDDDGTDKECEDFLTDDGLGNVFSLGGYFDEGAELKLVVVQFPNDSPFLDIFGPDKVKVGQEEWWSLLGYDSSGDDLLYFIDWGDGTYNNWMGPYSSGEEIEISHVYNSKGTFLIKAKAKDEYGAQSDWITLEVSAPKYKQNLITIFNWFHHYHLNLFLLLQRLFQRLI